VVDAFDGPVAEDLGRVNALTALGVGDAEAWRALASHPQLGAAAADLARSVESGTLLVEGLRQHAVSARRQRRAALEVAARGVGVRSVLPLMCCFIPAFVLLGVVPSVASALARALSF
jgi:pilus assembly protein TadC